LLVVVTLIVSVMVVTGDRPPATAVPSPVSPGVYVVGGTGPSTPEADRFSLAGITSGQTPLVPNQKAGQPSGGPFGGMAITPNAATVVVLRHDGGVSTLDVATGSLSNPLVLVDPGGAGQVAADPADSTKAFVALGTGNVFRVSFGSGPGPPVATPIAALAITAQTLVAAPDGQTVYIGGRDKTPDHRQAVVAVPANGGAPVTWSPPPSSGGVTDLALTPDGTRLFGADGASVFALGLPLSPTEATALSRPMPGARTVTVAPNGTTVYAGGVANGQAFVAGFPVAAPNPTVSQGLGPAGPGGVVGLAVSPDAGTLVATRGDPGSPSTTITAVPVNGGTPLRPGPPMAIPLGFQTDNGDQVAVTPDQAPAARFVAQPQPLGTPSTFDATGSSVAYGSITTYQWSFGDGVAVTTTGPTIAHNYAHPGTFTITLVETDSAGTTVPPAVAGTPWAVDGPGQTPYRLASPAASATATITVPAATLPTTPAATGSTVAGQLQAPVPQLATNPTVGPPGTIVTVTGAGFPPNTTVTVLWSVSSGAAVTTTDAAGDLITQLLILVPDVLGPRYAMVASFPGATAPFLVVAGGVEPGGSNADPVFRSESP
jgi:hypothetical protein